MSEKEAAAARGSGRPRPSREEQVAGRCKHFTGTMNKTCSVGVCYDDVKRPVPGDTAGLPCVLRLGGDLIGCPAREFPTTEEVAATIARQDQSLRDMVTARAAIVEAIGPYKPRKSPDARGTLACPICTTGTLGYRRAAYNGHVHARCSTEGCVAWME